MNNKTMKVFVCLIVGLAGGLILLVDTLSDVLPVWTVYFGFLILLLGAIATNIMYQVNKRQAKKEKESLLKNEIKCQVCQHIIKNTEDFVKTNYDRMEGLSHKSCADTAKVSKV